MWPHFESQDWLQGLDQLASNDYVVFDHFLPEERAARIVATIQGVQCRRGTSGSQDWKFR